VAYKRRYLEGGRWRYQYVIDPTAERIIAQYSIDPSKVETALSLAKNPEQRIKFQADVQDFVDMGISSTINLPAWGTEWNNEETAKALSQTLAEYCPRLRGITAYPDNARGGQPITEVGYEEAKVQKGVIFTENEDTCKSGICGV
jgi:ribonucleoside-diphosphate reductase alpha chain